MGQPDLQFHQILKDLQWIFSSPPLTEANQYSFEQQPLDQHWLNTIRQSPEKISGFMADKNLRMLGPYFEALWEFYFLNYPEKKLIAKNLQVFSGNKTIGEFDFIYLDEATGEYRHLEVAIKYFLGVEDLNARTSVNSSAVVSNAMNCSAINRSAINSSAINCDGGINKADKSVNDYSPMSQWLGPNANDRLDKKYIKMQEQQSQLSQTTEGKAALEKLNVLSSNIKSEICLLGYLFYPLDEGKDREQMLAPQYSHISHNKGYWLKIGQIEKILPEGSLWKIIDKPFWMAPLQKTRQQLQTREEIINCIKQLFIESQRPLLISNFINASRNNGAEYESDNKYFVVSDSWPEVD